MTVRTPSETLVSALEDFGQSEPKNVIVIWINEDGDLNWSKSAPLGFSETVGMLECVKAAQMRDFCSEENRK